MLFVYIAFWSGSDGVDPWWIFRVWERELWRGKWSPSRCDRRRHRRYHQLPSGSLQSVDIKYA